MNKLLALTFCIALSACGKVEDTCAFLDKGFLKPESHLRGLPNVSMSYDKATDQIIHKCFDKHSYDGAPISFMRQARDQTGTLYYIYVPEATPDVALVFQIGKDGKPVAAYRD